MMFWFLISLRVYRTVQRWTNRMLSMICHLLVRVVWNTCGCSTRTDASGDCRAGRAENQQWALRVGLSLLDSRSNHARYNELWSACWHATKLVDYWHLLKASPNILRLIVTLGSMLSLQLDRNCRAADVFIVDWYWVLAGEAHQQIWLII